MKQLFIVLLLLSGRCAGQIEIGVNAGYASMLSSSEKSSGYVIASSSKWPQSGSREDITASVTIARIVKVGIGYQLSAQIEKMKSPFAFLDYSRNIGRSELFAGICAGSVNFDNKIYTQFTATGHGSQYGFHAGYAYNVFNGLCIVAQAGYELLNASAKGIGNYEGATKTYLSSYMPIEIGVHYKINLSQKIKRDG